MMKVFNSKGFEITVSPTKERILNGNCKLVHPDRDGKEFTIVDGVYKNCKAKILYTCLDSGRYSYTCLMLEGVDKNKEICFN